MFQSEGGRLFLELLEAGGCSYSFDIGAPVTFLAGGHLELNLHVDRVVIFLCGLHLSVVVLLSCFGSFSLLNRLYVFQINLNF